MNKPPKSAKKRGPKSNHLKIDEQNWEIAAKKAIQKKKPKEGWPKKGKKNRKFD